MSGTLQTKLAWGERVGRGGVGREWGGGEWGESGEGGEWSKSMDQFHVTSSKAVSSTFVECLMWLQLYDFKIQDTT